MTKQLLVEIKDEIAFLTLNRPDKLNAFSPELVQALIDELKAAEQNDDVKAIVLIGSGRAFCAGGDISTMDSRRDPGTITKSMKFSSSLTQTILSLDKYVIAAVHGYAAGAGFSLALACDFIVADEEAQFISSFNNIGLIPDLGLVKLLAERVPAPRAKEWISSSKRVTATEGKEAGIVSRVVTGDLQEEVIKFASFIVDGPPLANKYVKYLINHASEFSHHTSIMQENMIQSLMFQTADAKEGVAAFREKRKPDFKGE